MKRLINLLLNQLLINYIVLNIYFYIIFIMKNSLFKHKITIITKFIQFIIYIIYLI
jgi:hypothetical protein